ncbi:uncharacterized protein LOC117186380 isoform X2 [Drosophila miranda]|uniref:uncharacterized protein LOC117186380 isoform X2 n=1 Tax=Drosophila miranda TaxID=7229 RepID=UPI00143F2140|nr:uncharacterized protein LOC117186380 isoform X2 [Drosophila miranda]
MLLVSGVWASSNQVQERGGSHRMLPQMRRERAQGGNLSKRSAVFHLHRYAGSRRCPAARSVPYQTRESPGFILDATKKAAIRLCGATPLQLSLSSAAAGFVRAKVGGTLDNLAADARGRHPVAIGGDFNAWAEEWGSVATNARGRALLEIIAPLDIALLNEGNQHTFSRAGIGSVIDLTFVSSSLFNSSGWSISNIYTGSDHRAIIWDTGQQTSSVETAAPRWRCYRAETLNTALFMELMSNLTANGNAECMANHVMEHLEAACTATMAQRKHYGRHHQPVFWWN